MIPSGFCDCNQPINMNFTDFEKETRKSSEYLNQFLLSALNDIIEPIKDQCEIFSKIDKISSIEKKIYNNVYYYEVSHT